MKNKTIIIGLTVSLLLSTTAGRAAYTPTLEDDSIYEITNVSSAEEADFSLVEIDENGQAAVTYYKYNIKEGAVSHEPLDEDMKGQDITGNFFGQTGGNGAAITNRTDTVFNSWDIGNITGDFVNNSVEGNLFNGPQGGAIYNRPLNGGSTSIGNITGDFIGNSAVSEIDLAVLRRRHLQLDQCRGTDSHHRRYYRQFHRQPRFKRQHSRLRRRNLQLQL